MEDYNYDYPREPIGGGNPYWRCSSCKRSDPQINGRISGHHSYCEWRHNQNNEENVCRNLLKHIVLGAVKRDEKYYLPELVLSDLSQAQVELFLSIVNE